MVELLGFTIKQKLQASTYFEKTKTEFKKKKENQF